MQKISEYEQHAIECRKSAAEMKELILWPSYGKRSL